MICLCRRDLLMHNSVTHCGKSPHDARHRKDCKQAGNHSVQGYLFAFDFRTALQAVRPAAICTSTGKRHNNKHAHSLISPRISWDQGRDFLCCGGNVVKNLSLDQGLDGTRLPRSFNYTTDWNDELAAPTTVATAGPCMGSSGPSPALPAGDGHRWAK